MKWIIGLAGSLTLAVGSAMAADVLVSGNTLSVAEPGSHVVVLVGTPDGDVLEVRGEGAVLVNLPAGAPDGSYRYDVYTESDSGSDIEHGEVTLEGGVLRLEFNEGEERSSSLLSPVWVALNWTLTRLIPSAEAADVTVSDNIPELFFDDTDNNTPAWGVNDWSVLAADASPTSGGVFLIRSLSQGGVHNVVHLESDSIRKTLYSTSTSVQLANGDLTVDHVNNRVGINTSSPAKALHVRSIDASLGSDNEVMARIENVTGTVGTRTMLDLINNGRVNLSLTDTAAGTKYELGTATANGQFAVMSNGVALMKITNTGRVRFGSGGSPSMDVSNTGNVTIAGTLTEMSDVNAKQDIKPIDGQYVLAKLDTLEVSSWQYKDTPTSEHIGPMAQDFHAAFGLGDDETHISARDMAGVNMAAIKAQQGEIRAQQKKIRFLEESNIKKDAEISELSNGLKQALQAVESMKVRLEAVEAGNPLIQASMH